MHPIPLYLDTSVIGGYFDKEFMADTRTLWALKDEDYFSFKSSVLVADEVASAPQQVRSLLSARIPPVDILTLSPRALELARYYMAAKVVPQAYENDALHVALCTVARITHLVSWNFKHLTNVQREAGFNRVNSLQGHPTLHIISPTTLIHGHQDKEILRRRARITPLETGDR